MDYEKKYKALVEAVKTLKETNPSDEGIQNWVNDNVPELKESEDERIRKHIIEILRRLAPCHFDGNERSECIAWLEKQCEQKPAEYTLEQAAGIFLDALSNTPYNNKPITDAQVITKELLKFLSDAHSYNPNAINEQKPADKVEPKFKVGDWVVYDHRPYQVVELPKEGYINLGLRRNGKIEFAPSTYCRHWTTQDAKDGDVLCCSQIILLFKQWEDDPDYNFVIAHAGIDISGKRQITNEHRLISYYTHPATKEQRELLFAKMHESGYEWDAEKKELKKIEQKPAWSEEDKCMLNNVIDTLKPLSQTTHSGYAINSMIAWLKSLKDRCLPQPKQEWSEEDETVLNNLIYALANDRIGNDRDEYVSWLKSLRPQNTWKPSEEQVKALLWVIENTTKSKDVNILLNSLYEDLKTL